MEVLAHPNPSLKQHAQAVDPLEDKDLLQLCQRMGQAMYDAPGIGLAAPQVGVMKRVIVYDLQEDEDSSLVALCNPVIVARSEECESDEEGCLSLPGISVPVTRHCAVVCEALALDGTPVRIEAEALHARLLQHEIDHLDGVLIIDRANPEDRKAAIRRYMELRDKGTVAHVREEL
jgi:peptide deformylase